MNSGQDRRLARSRARLAIIALVAVAMVVGVSAGACGDDDTSSAAPTTSATVAGTTTAASTTSPTTAPSATTVAAASPTAAATTGKETKEVLTIGGVKREATIYVPAKLSAAKAPAIVYLTSPGFATVPLRERYGVHLDAEADKVGFVAVWPEGSPAPPAQGQTAPCCYWNGGSIDFGSGPPPDDIAFFKALLDLLVAKYPVDNDRISFLGTAASSGAMGYRVACEMADRISAFADVSSGHRDNTSCATARPVSMLLMHGTANPNALYGGGINPNTGKVVPAVTELIDYWRKLNECTGDAATTMLTTVTEQRRYGPCKGGTEVVLVTVKDGGATGGWWGSDFPGVPAASGDPNLKSTPVVAQFLIKQTRAGR